MKKTILILFVLLYACCCHAQSIERLSKIEIEENETPRAVAYNFVKSITSKRIMSECNCSPRRSSAQNCRNGKKM